MSVSTTASIDVRQVAPRDRHPLIFSTFRSLATGQAFELVNDHDPKPLQHHFQAELPGQFAWDCLQAGPVEWRVRITRVADAPQGAGRCCGGCGCA